MQVETKEFLEMAEASHSICSFDIESFGLRGDYGSIICVSIKPYQEEAMTFMIEQPGNDRKVIREAAEELRKYKLWITYYGKLFDFKLLNTRLLKWNLPDLKSQLHLDLYQIAKAHLLTARRSLGHLNSWLETYDQKMSVSADEWVRLMSGNPQSKKILQDRCESDCKNTEDLYEYLKHLVVNITR